MTTKHGYPRQSMSAIEMLRQLARATKTLSTALMMGRRTH